RLAQVFGFGATLAGKLAEATLPEPGSHAAHGHAERHGGKQEYEEGQGDGEARIAGIERIHGERYHLAIGHRQRHEDDGKRHEDHDEDEAVDHGLTCRRNAAYLLPFSRSRNSLPVLKKGTHFSSTSTDSPVRGLRPV